MNKYRFFLYNLAFDALLAEQRALLQKMPPELRAAALRPRRRKRPAPARPGTDAWLASHAKPATVLSVRTVPRSIS